MQWAFKKPTGFTIVELLIVVVVIAILATITIVAYNGIQQRAKVSTVQSGASQAGKKILSYAPQNNDQFPLEATYTSDVSLPPSTPQVTYDYYVSDDQKSFCISVTDTTTNPEMAYAFTQRGQVVQGRCVKNYIANPNFDSNATGWGTYQVSLAQQQATGGINNSGLYAIRRAAGVSDPLAAINPPANTFSPSTTYTISYWNWADSAQAQQGFIGLQEAGSGWRQLVTTTSGTSVATTPTRRSATATTPADMYATLRFVMRPVSNDSITAYFDNIMVTRGSKLYSYGDGDQPNWSWVGAARSSASFGPAVQQ